MFAASSALSPATMSSYMPRPTPQPLRRVFAALLTAATVLALLVASALPARAARQGDALGKAVVATLVAAPSVDKGRITPNPAQPLVEVRSPRVPAVCALRISGTRRDVTVYPERCLRREGFDYRLPRQCAYQARVFGRPDRVYAQDCLRNAGFSVDHGRGPSRGDRGFGRDHGRGFDNGYGRPRHSY
ncbi:MAG: hypothetical protein Q7J44_10865 [Pseudotabrizicola sp.]|uniref:hypothetical protein n=1 Tax=Pseudotabrizicola sp. TaxID=2939647 RepID=UPI002728F896|nr:hypothetical protein [Pseudotabrizicola sp.]MDO9639033.1 hypothetical protein [Pseudotabrizicola sp.]